MSQFEITVEYTYDSGYTGRVLDVKQNTVAIFQGNNTWQDAHAMAENWIRKQGVRRAT